MNRTRTSSACGFALAALALLIGVGSADAQLSADVQKRQIDVNAAIAQVKTTDPGLQRFFDDSYGYAVFPSIAKGAIGIGGAYGKGLVYDQGALTGEAELAQATIGLQLGGQAYLEIIFFRDKVDLDRFKSGSFEFAAQASAVAVTAGASADVDYSKGVAVFTQAKAGLMYEASIGGQTFKYSAL